MTVRVGNASQEILERKVQVKRYEDDENLKKQSIFTDNFVKLKKKSL